MLIKNGLLVRRDLFVVLLVLGGLFFFLVFRSLGLSPMVFADEYSYSRFSRLLPLSEATIPAYLYLKIYSATNYCGNGFLECVRVINAVFFLLAAPFIYLITRSVASRSISTLVTLLALAGPINTYTAYFMPESLYFLVFWVFCWLILNLKADSKNYNWFASGVVFGVLSLIKVHAIFLFPAVLAYIGYVFYQSSSLFSRRMLYVSACFVFSALAVKILIGYILAGDVGVTVFGPLYGSIATSATSNPGRYIELAKLAASNMQGHLYVLAIIYGLPLAVSIVVLIMFFKGAKNTHNEIMQDNQLAKLSFFSISVISSLVIITSFFTVYADNTISRLHLRYYNFALPLLYIVTAGSLFLKKRQGENFLRYIIGSLVFVLAAYAVYNKLLSYRPSVIDGPEISIFTPEAYNIGSAFLNPHFFTIGLLVSLAVWIFYDTKGARVYIYLALPLFVFVSFVTANQLLRLSGLPSYVDDEAGVFAKRYLTEEEKSRLLVIGSSDAGALRTLFHIDSPYVPLLYKVIDKVADVNSNIEVFDIPDEKEWVLLVSGNREYTLPRGSYFKLPMRGFSLIRLSWQGALDFSKGGSLGLLSKAQGLSFAEDWGAWSDSDVVSMQFARVLPKKFDLQFSAYSFGPNVGEDFQVIVGASVKTFKLGSEPSSHTFTFNNSDLGYTIRFVVPKPTSPVALGLGNDERKLGIGFIEMKIVPAE